MSRYAGNQQTRCFLELGAVFTLLRLVFARVGVLFSGVPGRWLRSRPDPARALHYATGGILVGLEVRLALLGRG